MSWAALPPGAAWRHQGSRSGFEVAWFAADGGGHVLTGRTVAVEAGGIWTVDYEIRVDTAWRTRSARVSGRSGAGSGSVLLHSDGAGSWQVDGRAEPLLDGCLDVDLEASAMTNALLVRRLDLPTGGHEAAPAAYVRAQTRTVERLEQDYQRLDGQTYAYAAPAFDFRCRLRYDSAGLALDYPGIAVRAG